MLRRIRFTNDDSGNVDILSTSSNCISTKNADIDDTVSDISLKILFYDNKISRKCIVISLQYMLLNILVSRVILIRVEVLSL